MTLSVSQALKQLISRLSANQNSTLNCQINSLFKLIYHHVLSSRRLHNIKEHINLILLSTNPCSLLVHTPPTIHPLILSILLLNQSTSTSRPCSAYNSSTYFIKSPPQPINFHLLSMLRLQFIHSFYQVSSSTNQLPPPVHAPPTIHPLILSSLLLNQ